MVLQHAQEIASAAAGIQIKDAVLSEALACGAAEVYMNAFPQTDTNVPVCVS